MHVSIHSFMDACFFLVPGFTMAEAAKAYIKRHKIDEDLYSQDTVIAIYYRVCKDLNDLQKSKDKEKASPIKI